MDNSYRIKANVGTDQVLNVSLKQNIDIYEILSLKLRQENLYKLHSADYGVIVGRVLANNAFGVPNAKVTVFIPLSNTDKLRQGIRDIYPYNFVTDVDNRNVRFNVLPNYKRFECHQEVGSFPNKRLVLDEDSVLEIYDKYYKYTTITNNAGDYMIFGVPTGEHVLHVDVDLSDIGILSQEPRDFIYKGYSADLFESPTQFKKSTNLDELPQIQSQNTSVTVYPLWGDKNANEIAITRKDINLQYEFEATCIFIGSVITDNGQNSIAHNCVPDENVGDASQLSPSNGSIEMIRKTTDGNIEEYQIKGGRLIDDDGTWCYQIPMNLDYIGTDEYGNIVPTNNPLKGIPTRARVRFRFTLDESVGGGSTHTARYLVPNNPDMYEGFVEPHIHVDTLDKDSYYEFGTLTNENCFRDLYWNKVYSVKNYIPRIQPSKHEKTSRYLAIKGVNKSGAKKNNAIPFNRLNLNLSLPALYMACFYSIGYGGVSGFWRFLKSSSILYSADTVREKIVEQFDAIGLDFYNDWLNGCLYFPSWFWYKKQKNSRTNEYDSEFCECKNKVEGDASQNLYLLNNCSLLYKNENLEILTENTNTSDYIYRLFNGLYNSITFGSKLFYDGIIKKKVNKDGIDIFYYSFGSKFSKNSENGNTSFDAQFPEEIRPTNDDKYYKYVRLFSTDIILLGSLKDCDLHGVPKIVNNIPSTTANIPELGRYKPQSEPVSPDVKEQMPQYEEGDIENYILGHNGMNWGAHWHTPSRNSILNIAQSVLSSFGVNFPYKYRFGSGLFFGLSSYRTYAESIVQYPYTRDWATSLVMVTAESITAAFRRIDIVPYSDLKTCVNVERISELGVTLDSDIKLDYDEDEEGYGFISEMDGLITKREIENVDLRAIFATLNSNKLLGTIENHNTGYKKYDLKYFYPTNFDGRMGDDLWVFRNCDYKSIAEYYTSGITIDNRNKDYLDFRFGNNASAYTYSYKKIAIGFDGKVKKIKYKDNSNSYVINVVNGEYSKYKINDGYAKFSRFIKPKTRHFYGYKKNIDNVYPFSVIDNRETFSDYPYTFPLYDNSFYFYFGLNIGKTAIDKFYNQFYSGCKKQVS